MAAAPKPAKEWRPRIPDSRDVAVLEALHAARVLTVPQLQRLYGLESASSLHPRLHGLLGPEGTPRILERERGPDGRFYYAVGRGGYRYLPTDPPPVRHKLLAHMRLSPQWLDHTLAVGWLMVTWLTGGGDWQLDGSTLGWWSEHRAILPYPLPRQRGPVTHGRVEPDGVALLTLPDGTRWTGAIEHDAGSEDSADWAAKLARWAAVIRCGSWQDRFGDTAPHLLITVPSAARRAQIAPWVAAGRKEHGRFYAWIAVHGEVSVGEGDPLGAAVERVTSPAWVQVTGVPAKPLQETPMDLPDIIDGSAPWRPQVTAAPPQGPGHPLPVDLDAQVRAQLQAQVATHAATIRNLQAERDRWRERATEHHVTITNLEHQCRALQSAYTQLLADQPAVRLQRYWAVRHPLLLAGRGIAFAAGLLLIGVLGTVLWSVGVQTWDMALNFDPGLSALAATGPPVLTLLAALWGTPWCGGPLLLGSLVGTVAAWRWARRSPLPPR